MHTKNIVFSKTFWANFITLVIGLVAMVSGQDWIPAELSIYITAGLLPILNIVLRFFTDSEVTVVPRRM